MCNINIVKATLLAWPLAQASITYLFLSHFYALLKFHSVLENVPLLSKENSSVGLITARYGQK